MEHTYIDLVPQNNKIKCCLCSVLIDTNPSNTCINCLKSNVDISEGIPKQVNIYFCKGCERYQVGPGTWQLCSLESRELLALCIKKLKNINKIHLVDANFIYTEPHSKRIKIKLTIQKEVFSGAILQQIFIVEYIVQNLFCEACHRKEANDFWTAVVQVRQKISHKKTLFYLEQLIIKHQAHSNTVNIKSKPDGIDFYFDKKDDGVKFVDFLQSVIPCRYTASQQLISHDTHSNTYKYKFTYSVKVVPICKDDIMCLPLPLAKYLGDIGQICICLRITNNVYLIDPFTLKKAELSEQYYFKYPFNSFATSRMLTHYIVIEIEFIKNIPKQIGKNYSTKHKLADVWLIKRSEFGKHKNYIHTRTHLGLLLNPGDTVLAFDVENSNLNDVNLEKFSNKNNFLPEVIIVKKFYLDRATRNARRKWMLKRIKMNEDSKESTNNNEFNEFMEDLEEDNELRANMNIYKDPNLKHVETDLSEDEIPQISINEMLENLDETSLDQNKQETKMDINLC